MEGNENFFYYSLKERKIPFEDCDDSHFEKWCDEYWRELRREEIKKDPSLSRTLYTGDLGFSKRDNNDEF